MIKLKEFWEQVKKDNEPNIDRIKAYWDEKTLFVHRRALLTGAFLGGFLGADLVILIWILTK
jgi:hypothetical protein